MISYPNLALWLHMITGLAIAVGVVRSGSGKKVVDAVVIAAAFTSILAIGVTYEFAHSGEFIGHGFLLLCAMFVLAFFTWRLVARPYALLIFTPATLGVGVFAFNLSHRDSGLSLLWSWVY